MNTRNLFRLTAIALATGALTLVGCSQADRDEAKAKTDSAVETVKDKSAELAADTKKAGAEIKADAKDLAADAKAKTSEMAADTKSSVADATITASVKAELAKDPVLKAHDINVDTSAGTVSLRGAAPSAEARDRATTLATAVSGVVNVKNELTVAAAS